MTVFVYEDVTATGAGGDFGSPPAPSLLAEGRAMRDAVAADFAAVMGIRVLSPGEPGASATGASLTPVANAPGSPGFSELAAKAGFTLVIAPECGRRLEQLSREVLRVGGQLLGPSPEAIRLTADKLALARHWEAHGVPTPATWELGRQPVDVLVVIKPQDGAGSQATYLWQARSPSPPGFAGRVGLGVRGDKLAPSGDNHLTWRDPSRSPLTPLPHKAGGEGDQAPAPTWLGPMIAQAYVPGFAASVAFLIGPSQTVPLIPCEQLLSADCRFTYLGGRLPIAPVLAARALQIASEAICCVPGLLGFVGVDVILGDDERDWAIEINPRLTTSYVGLRALARFNLAEAMLGVVRKQLVADMAWHDRQLEFTPDGRVFDVAPTPSKAASA
jgi:tyramine---L-glutamate ligase